MARTGPLPAVALCLALWGCESAPAASTLKEWVRSDHHSSDDDRPTGAQQAQGQRQATGNETAQLVELTWRQQCTTCHGAGGRGDGQMGPMLHAPDLTQADLQASVTDDQMVSLIRAGKDKMPAFNLPEPVLRGLVARIRQLRGR